MSLRDSAASYSIAAATVHCMIVSSYGDEDGAKKDARSLLGRSEKRIERKEIIIIMSVTDLFLWWQTFLRTQYIH